MMLVEGLSCGFSAKPTFYDSFDGFCSQMLHMPLSQLMLGRGFSCYSACLRGRPPPSRRPGGFVRIPSGSRSRRDECPPSWGIVAIELETRTCFAGGQGFGFEACGWLPQASDGESMRHQRELDVSPNGWARRLRPTGAVTLPAQTGR